MVGGLERDQPTGLGGQPLLQAAVPGLTDAFIHNLEWHLRQAWEPLLWTEKAPKANGGKKATGLNEEGMKVMRYRDLLHELAAYTRNTLHFSQAEKATLTLIPTPSPLQQKAFDLLRINPAL